MPPKVLILGGTGEARELAAALTNAGFSILTSLAGVTASPQLPPGAVRRGGFGGAEGLAVFLREEGFVAVVEATHPFAAQISRHASAAAAEAGVLLLRLERRPWSPGPGDCWFVVTDAASAVAALPAGAKALVTIGRKEIAAFLDRPDISGVARMIERPQLVVPPSWMLLLKRPPFTLEEELELMTQHCISHLVTKNAGGSETQSKLLAARIAQIPVIMIERPPRPEVPTFSTPDELTEVLCGVLSP